MSRLFTQLRRAVADINNASYKMVDLRMGPEERRDRRSVGR